MFKIEKKHFIFIFYIIHQKYRKIIVQFFYNFINSMNNIKLYFYYKY